MDPSGGHVMLDVSSDKEGLVSNVPKGSDSDEVVLVKEVNAKSKRIKLVMDDDDDCVVLDGDPEKSVFVPDDAADGGSDDLLIVGEKGQVACRDYPHPRHDCVIFPFSSTLHEKHCNLCHCYVCDSSAPCAYWGKGLPNVDHCHADDKQEKWKVCRKNFMQGKTTLMPVSSFLPDPVSTVLPQPTQALPPINTPPPTNSIPQNLVPRPTIFQPCSSPTRSSVSSNIKEPQEAPSRHVSRSRFQPLSSARQVSSVPITEPAHEAQPAREFTTTAAGNFDISAAGVEYVDFDHWWLETQIPEDNFPPVPAAVDGVEYVDFDHWWLEVMIPEPFP
ncbi:hypothetical protein ACJRO7_007214 [Eucalyptus globulus]|uniref:RPM1 interacting protein 13 n=1 Tax=Eucalyptus globulus TaxID=34317 RepID=A0ABD3IKE9_EUCGL